MTKSSNTDWLSILLGILATVKESIARWINPRDSAKTAAIMQVRKDLGIDGSRNERAATIEKLGGPGAQPLFTLPSGEVLCVRQAIIADGNHAFICGKTGSGKTFFTIYTIIDNNIEELLAGRRRCIVIDPKQETAVLLMRRLAAKFIRGDSHLRDELRQGVHAIVFRRGFVTPISPFVPNEHVSNAYLAEFLTDTMVRTSRTPVSITVAQLLYYVIWLCIELGIPLSVRFIRKFLRNAGYRQKILARIENRDLRLFFETLSQTVAKQTIDAVIRRFVSEVKFPENLAALGLPAEEIKKLGVPTDAPLTVADFGASNILPPSIGLMHAEIFATRTLLAAKGRDKRVPLQIVLEELPRLLDRSPQLTALVLDSLQTLRASRTSITMCAQRLDSLAREVVRDIELNTSWITAFQSRADVGDLLVPYLSPVPGVSEAERRREFLRELGALPPQHAYFYVNGHAPFRVRSIDMIPPARIAGIPDDELDDVFFREITPRSTIAIDRALAINAAWEDEFVGDDESDSVKGKSEARGLDDLRSFLEGDDEDA